MLEGPRYCDCWKEKRVEECLSLDEFYFTDVGGCMVWIEVEHMVVSWSIQLESLGEFVQ